MRLENLAMSHERWEEIVVGDQSMPAYTISPTAAEPKPGVLVCMHAPGVDPFIRDIVRRLAEGGWVAMAPDLYHRQARDERSPLERMAELRDEELLDDLAAASKHLAQLRECDAARIATIGFCMGGRIALLHATAKPFLRAAVLFYGGNIFKAWGESEPTPFDRLPSLNTPLLGLFGNDDNNPSPADVDRLAERLTQLAKPHQFHRYDGAGHAFLNFQRDSYREAAAADAWRRCVDFLQEQLGSR